MRLADEVAEHIGMARRNCQIGVIQNPPYFNDLFFVIIRLSNRDGYGYDASQHASPKNAYKTLVVVDLQDQFIRGFHSPHLEKGQNVEGGSIQFLVRLENLYITSFNKSDSRFRQVFFL